MRGMDLRTATMMLVVALAAIGDMIAVDAVPCVDFDVGTVSGGEDVVRGGVPRETNKWDGDETFAKGSVTDGTFYVSYPSKTSSGFSVIVESEAHVDEAKCAPTIDTSSEDACGAATSANGTCTVSVKYNCGNIGQSRIKITFSGIQYDGQACQGFDFSYTKTNGNALTVGTSPGARDVIDLGRVSADFDGHHYQQDAYAANITLFFEIPTGSLPLTHSQSFDGGVRNGLRVAVLAGAKMEADISGSLLDVDALAAGEGPKNLTVTYACKSFGWSTVQVSVMMDPFSSPLTFAWKKYCTHVTGLTVVGDWTDGEGRDVSSTAVVNGMVNGRWGSNDDDVEFVRHSYAVKSIAFTVSNAKQNTSFARPTLDVSLDALASGRCDPSLRFVGCDDSGSVNDCKVDPEHQLLLQIDYNCTSDANGYLTLAIDMKFEEAMSISFHWYKYVGNRPGFNVDLMPSYRFIDRFRNETSIVLDGAVPAGSSWASYAVSLTSDIVYLPMTFYTSNDDQAFKVPVVEVNQLDHQQCPQHVRIASPDNGLVSRTNETTVEIFFFCKDQVSDMKIFVTIKDAYFREAVFTLRKSSAEGWSQGLGFKMIHQLARDLDSHRWDGSIVFADNAVNQPKPSNPFAWGEDSYTVEGDITNGCKNADGEFVGCTVRDANHIASRSFSFGMEKTTDGVVDANGCTFDEPIFYMTGTHCRVNATVTVVGNDVVDDANATTRPIPSWGPEGGPAWLTVDYDCDNVHSAVVFDTDVVMEIPLACEDAGSFQPVLVRWWKSSGAEFPDRPDPPSVESVSDGAVTLELIVPNSFGNAATSLIVERTYTTSNGSTFDDLIDIEPTTGTTNFTDGMLVRYVDTELVNGIAYAYRVAAINVRGQGEFSDYSTSAYPKKDSTKLSWWWFAAGGGGFFVVAISVYTYCRRRRQKDSGADNFEGAYRDISDADVVEVDGEVVDFEYDDEVDGSALFAPVSSDLNARLEELRGDSNASLVDSAA